MTILFHTNIRNLMIGRGIIAGLGAPCGITVYSGVQPTAAEILANWGLYNSANAKFLANFAGATWTHPLSGATTFTSITTFPSAAVANNTGVGTWCIIWSMNPSVAQLAAAGIPSTSFIVGPVSDSAGQGIVRFNPNTTFTAGVAKSITDGVISASST